MPSYPGADGATLHYDVLGDDAAPSLVALGGGPGRHPAYLGDLAGLSARWRLVVPHLRGVGESPRPADPTQGSAWHQAEDLEALREHLGLATLSVVGHSAGTRLAVAYAARWPQRVDRLVLVTPPAQGLSSAPSDAEAIAAQRRGDPLADRALAALASDDEPASDAALTAWHRTVAPITYARWGDAERAHAAVGAFHLGAATDYFSVAAPADLAARLTALAAPVLVVAGADDVLTGLAPVVALADAIPHGRCVVLDGCGHYPWVERPAAFRAAVDPFLEAGLGSSTAG